MTKSQVRWVRSDLGTAALSREVAALRCGLDATAWDGDGSEKCTKALGRPAHRSHCPSITPAPTRSTAALFGEVQDLIKDKHLLIVPSGPLTQLPFQVLVTRAPASGDHRAAAWLAREHAITVLPAVSSLKALRRVGKPSTAPRPMIGIGNPLLDGPDARYVPRAKHARPSNAARSNVRSRWRRAAIIAQARHGSRRGVALPTCPTSKDRCRCPRPPTSCAPWPRT